MSFSNLHQFLSRLLEEERGVCWDLTITSVCVSFIKLLPQTSKQLYKMPLCVKALQLTFTGAKRPRPVPAWHVHVLHVLWQFAFVNAIILYSCVCVCVWSGVYNQLFALVWCTKEKKVLLSCAVTMHHQLQPLSCLNRWYFVLLFCSFVLFFCFLFFFKIQKSFTVHITLLYTQYTEY